MRTIIISLLCILGIIFFCLLYQICDADNRAMKNECERQEKIKSHIGEKIVVDKDTLTITDADFWNSNYILSNGKEVDFSFVNKK